MPHSSPIKGAAFPQGYEGPLGPSPSAQPSVPPLLAGLFVSVLILSLVFASRLRPASRAPLLFRPDTNIQVLLDLKYNLSAEGISCITCSGERSASESPVAPCSLWSSGLKDCWPTRCKIQAPHHHATLANHSTSESEGFPIS